jgi:hypothetical protein
VRQPDNDRQPWKVWCRTPFGGSLIDLLGVTSEFFGRGDSG